MPLSISTPARKATSRGGQRSSLTGIAFASPWIVGFLGLTAVPIVASAYFSFTDFNVFQSPTWVGLANYTALLHDDLFYKALWNTGVLTVIGVPLGIGLALVCALALSMDVRGQPLYRALLYLPSIVPLVTTTYLWRWMLNAQYGAVNQILIWLHLPQPNWLEDPLWTKPAVMLITFWGIGTTTVIYLAALKQVPQDLHEAAQMDGANLWQRFWHVTWPMITPITLFQMIVGIIGALQIFTQPWLLAQTKALGAHSAGPDNSLLTYGMYIYENAFSFLKMGYASALAWILFLITMVLTAILLLSARRWVHYETKP